MYDLATVVQQMRLDRLAVDASRCLTEAAVPHVLIKGPTTARWLYRPPRVYRDVDLLVPHSRARAAAAALSAAGIAHPTAGRLGEEASHSWLLVSPVGYEVDLHVTLPMLVVTRRNASVNGLWAALAGHVTPFALEGVDVPALDLAARCVVLVLHAVGNGYSDEASLEDLRRAQQLAGPDVWAEAQQLARELEVQPLFAAGLALAVGGSLPEHLPRDARLRLQGDRGLDFQLERLAMARVRDVPMLLLRELFPSPGFMRYDDPSRTRTGTGLAVAYARRWGRLVVHLPGALRRWLASSRAGSDESARAAASPVSVSREGPDA